MRDTRARATLVSGLAGLVLAVTGLAWACTPQAEISLLPRSGVPGDLVKIEGKHFPERAPVDIRWNSIDGPSLAQPRGAAFTVTVAIPEAAPGVYSVIATSVNGAGDVVGRTSAAFQVMPGTSEQPRNQPGAETPQRRTTTTTTGARGQEMNGAGETSLATSGGRSTNDQSGESSTTTAAATEDTSATSGTTMRTTTAGSPSYARASAGHAPPAARPVRDGTRKSGPASSTETGPQGVFGGASKTDMTNRHLLPARGRTETLPRDGLAISKRSASDDPWGGFRSGTNGPTSLIANLPESDQWSTTSRLQLTLGLTLLIGGAAGLVTAAATLSRRRRLVHAGDSIGSS